jgi:hypothetical protein
MPVEARLEHRDWTIRARARELDRGRWSALVEVFAPGQTPRTHTGKAVPFPRVYPTAEDAVVAGVQAGKDWVDAAAVSPRRGVGS